MDLLYKGWPHIRLALGVTATTVNINIAKKWMNECCDYFFCFYYMLHCVKKSVLEKNSRIFDTKLNILALLLLFLSII